MVRVVSLRSAAAGKRGLGGELGFGGRGKEVRDAGGGVVGAA
jgi:hypothetical protein